MIYAFSGGVQTRRVPCHNLSNTTGPESGQKRLNCSAARVTMPGLDIGGAVLKMNDDGSFNLLIGATNPNEVWRALHI